MCCASKTATTFSQFFCVHTKSLPFFPRIIFRSHPYLNKNIMFFGFVLNYYVTIFCAKFLILFSDNDPQQIFIHDSFKNLFKSDAICRPVSCPNWNSDATYRKINHSTWGTTNAMQAKENYLCTTQKSSQTLKFCRAIQDSDWYYKLQIKHCWHLRSTNYSLCR